MAGVIVAFDGWNASGVGWGEQGWGEGVGNLTATGAVGTVVVAAESIVPVTGLQATGRLERSLLPLKLLSLSQDLRPPGS